MTARAGSHHGPIRYCSCEECVMIEVILRYMLTAMEPTDRALRPAGGAAA